MAQYPTQKDVAIKRQGDIEKARMIYAPESGLSHYSSAKRRTPYDSRLTPNSYGRVSDHRRKLTDMNRDLSPARN